MLIGLGFVAAALLAFLLAPPFWARAVRLTTRKIQSQSPLTMAEIQAERDQMRAEFAQTTRKLEVTVEELKKKNVDQSVDLAHYAEKSSVLETKNEELEKLLKAREDESEGLREVLEPLQSQMGDHTSRSKQLARELETVRADRDKLAGEIRDTSLRYREAAKIIERKDREIERLRKARTAGKAIPRRQRKKDPAREEIADKIDQISAQFEELNDRFAALRERGESLKSAKQDLDRKKVISHDEATAHRAAIADFESARKTLAGELVRLNNEFDLTQKELVERDTAWQQENENPFMELLESAGKLAGSMVLPTDTMDAEFSLEAIDTVAETAEAPEPVREKAPAKTKPEKTAKQAESDEKDDGKSGSGARGTSLAERIRALQNQIS